MARKFLARLRLLVVKVVVWTFAIRKPLRFSVCGRPFYLMPAVAGGSPDDDDGDGGKKDDADKGDDDDADADKGDKDDDDSDDDDDKGEKDAEHYRKQLRRLERGSKRRSAAADSKIKDLEKKLKDREDADKSDQQKAVDAAAEQARTESDEKHEKERRHDKLDVAATKIAARGIKVGEGKEAKTLRFTDPDDALVYLERDMKNGDLAEDDIFDSDGKVDRDKLEEALADLLDRKPHLAEEGKEAAGGKKKVDGGADGGKGGGDVKTGDEATTDDVFKQIRRNKPAS